MKRLNSETGKPFKKGDIDKNGCVFWNYKVGKPIKKNGFFQEVWCSNVSQYNKQKLISLKYTRKNQKENKEKYLKYRAEKYASIEGRAKMLIASAKQRAKVTITPEWVSEKIKNGFCEISGLPFDLNPDKKFYKNPYSPSLDKINSNIKEYSKLNTRVVLSCINDALNQYGLEHFLKVAKAVLDKQKEM